MYAVHASGKQSDLHAYGVQRMECIILNSCYTKNIQCILLARACFKKLRVRSRSASSSRSTSTEHYFFQPHPPAEERSKRLRVWWVDLIATRSECRSC